MAAEPRLKGPMFSLSFSLFSAGLRLLSGSKVLMTASDVPLVVADNYRTVTFPPHHLGKGESMVTFLTVTRGLLGFE